MLKQMECRFLIVGAGITGLTIARELLNRGAEDILIIEKEDRIGCHASGRNSGVLHAGIYYTPDTLKARFCAEGNQLMKEFCLEKGLTFKQRGKVVVARDASEIKGIYELKRRADLIGTKAVILNTMELSEIEPYAKTCEKALFTPTTAVIQPTQILNAIEEDLEHSGKAAILCRTDFNRLKNDHSAVTSKGIIHFEKFINTAGAFADKIAHRFGIGKEYKILPFKGTYKRLTKEKSFLVKGNIYPVPDLRNPFLGVHLTRSAEGRIYIGPTAIPTFGRENYGIFDGLGSETFLILYHDALLFLTNPVFRGSAITEIRKYRKKFIYNELEKIITGLNLQDIEDVNKVGIRAQLVNLRERKLVMDFLVLKDGNSLHILNAVSPAFTSSMAFAKYAVSDFI